MSPERRNRTISASQAAGGGNINGGSAMNTPLRPRTTSVINRDSPIFKSVMRGIEDGNSSDEDTRGFQDEEAEDLFVGGGRGGGVGRRSMPASPTKKASVSQYAPYSARDRPQSKPTSMSQSQVASSSNARTGGLRRTATLPEATFTNDLASHSMHGSTSANGGTTAATTTTSTRHQEFPYTRMPVEKLVTMIQQRDQLLVAKDRQIEAQQLQSRAQLQYTEALQQELNLMRDQLDFYQNEAVEVIVEGPPESPRLLLSPERSPRATYEPLRGLETPIRNIRFEETVSSMIRNGSSNGTTVTVTPAIPVRTTLNMGAMTPAATPGMRTTVGHGGGGGGGKPGAGEGENPQIVTSHFLPGADGRMEPRRTGEMWN
ncbi:hypothetical protein FRC16_004019 [Serendipita sp. 398]|nr:hypothetical protein FRC16_004019 [Serendipita sp. 398]